MIYSTPAVTAEDVAVLDQVEVLRTRLRFYLREPRRWYGTLRRSALARAVQGSNSIEGYHASLEDVAAVIDGEEPVNADQETRAAIEGYRDAMTYVLQLAGSQPMPTLDESLLRALHFMMLKYDLDKSPGRWRPGPVWVEDSDRRIVYEAPDRELVESLVAEMLDDVGATAGHPIVRASMAHLNLTLIHPFSDGNGRMARCVQSFVLAAGGASLSPEFLSIEEYLGRNTTDYYACLAEVASGRWTPERDARPWLHFCLTAHYRQALTLLRRIEETEALWDRCEQLARQHKLPDRCVGALCDAARGWRLHRSLYVKTVRSSTGEPLSEESATRDLRAMTNAGLLLAVGEKRGRYYTGGQVLRDGWTAIRRQRLARKDDDPYRLAGVAPYQQPLPGLT
jgi:Fic family protein